MYRILQNRRNQELENLFFLWVHIDGDDNVGRENIKKSFEKRQIQKY